MEPRREGTGLDLLITLRLLPRRGSVRNFNPPSSVVEDPDAEAAPEVRVEDEELHQRPRCVVPRVDVHLLHAPRLLVELAELAAHLRRAGVAPGDEVGHAVEETVALPAPPSRNRVLEGRRNQGLDVFLEMRQPDGHEAARDPRADKPIAQVVPLRIPARWRRNASGLSSAARIESGRREWQVPKRRAREASRR